MRACVRTCVRACVCTFTNLEYESTTHTAYPRPWHTCVSFARNHTRHADRHIIVLVALDVDDGERERRWNREQRDAGGTVGEIMNAENSFGTRVANW